MQNEQLVMVLQRCKDQEKFNGLLLELINKNAVLAHRIAAKFAWTADSYEDMKQLTYFAAKDAVRSWSVGDKFTTIYCVWLKYHYFRFMLSMRYSVKLTSRNWRSHQEFFLPYSVEERDVAVNMREISPKDIILCELRSSLKERDYVIIYSKFFKEESLQAIANQLGITRERVRVCQNRALKILRKNEILIEIAREYYGMFIP